MTMQQWPQRITLGSMAAIATMSLVEGITSAIGARDKAHVQEIHRPESNRVMVYFPALATDAVASAEHFLPLFERDSVLLVDYPRSGFDRERTFSLLAQMLERYRGKELLIYAVSMGSGVALNFRRYCKAHDRMLNWFPSVKFIFYSPVTAAWDVKFGFRMASCLGFIFRGGLVSRLSVNFILDTLLELSRNGALKSATFEDKIQQMRSALSVISIKLLASELRAVHYGKRGRRGEFQTDAALILTYQNDEVVTSDAPLRLAESFGSAQILPILPDGHADIAQSVASGGFAMALGHYLMTL